MSENDESQQEENKTLIASNLRIRNKTKRKKLAKQNKGILGRPRKVLPPKAEVPQYSTGFCPEGDKAWRWFVDGTAIPEIAAKMGRSNSVVHRWLVARTEHLQKIDTPEERAKVIGLVSDRYHRIWREAIDRAESSDDKGQGPAWMAIALKATELLAKTYGVGGDVAEVQDLSTARRMAEIAERMKLIGMNAHQLAAARAQALDAADVKIQPPAPTVKPPRPVATEVIDGRFEAV